MGKYLLDLRRVMQDFNVPMDETDEDKRQQNETAAAASGEGGVDQAVKPNVASVPLIVEPFPPLWHALSLKPHPSCPASYPDFIASDLLPGMGYPQLYPVGDILTAWHTNILAPPGTYGRFSSLRRLDAQTQGELAGFYRRSMAPFVVHNVSALEKAVVTVANDKELLAMLGGARSRYAGLEIDEGFAGGLLLPSAYWPVIDPSSPSPSASAADKGQKEEDVEGASGTLRACAAPGCTATGVTAGDWLRNGYILADELTGEERDQLPQWWGSTEEPILPREHWAAYRRWRADCGLSTTPDALLGPKGMDEFPGFTPFALAGQILTDASSQETAEAAVAAALAEARNDTSSSSASSAGGVKWAQIAPLQLASTGAWRAAPINGSSVHHASLVDQLAALRVHLATVRDRLPKRARKCLDRLPLPLPGGDAAAPTSLLRHGGQATEHGPANASDAASGGARSVPKPSRAGVRADIAAKQRGPPRPVARTPSGASGSPPAQVVNNTAPVQQRASEPRQLKAKAAASSSSSASASGRLRTGGKNGKGTAGGAKGQKAVTTTTAPRFADLLRVECSKADRAMAAGQYSLLCASATVHAAPESGIAVYPPSLSPGEGNTCTDAIASTATPPSLFPFLRFHPDIEHAYGLPVRRPLVGPLPRAKRVRQVLFASNAQSTTAEPLEASVVAKGKDDARGGSAAKPAEAVGRAWVGEHFAFLLHDENLFPGADLRTSRPDGGEQGDAENGEVRCSLSQPGVTSSIERQAHDTHIAVVRGYKRFLLIAPATGSDDAKFPAATEDWTQWSLVLGTQLHNGLATEVVLEPGDVLIMPRGWGLASVSLTVSVECWTQRDLADDEVVTPSASAFPYTDTANLLSGTAAALPVTKGSQRGALAFVAPPRIVPPVELATIVPFLAATDAPIPAIVAATSGQGNVTSMQPLSYAGESGRTPTAMVLVRQTHFDPNPASSLRNIVPLDVLVPPSRRVTTQDMMRVLGLKRAAHQPLGLGRVQLVQPAVSLESSASNKPPASSSLSAPPGTPSSVHVDVGKPHGDVGKPKDGTSKETTATASAGERGSSVKPPKPMDDDDAVPQRVGKPATHRTAVDADGQVPAAEPSTAPSAHLPSSSSSDKPLSEQGSGSPDAVLIGMCLLATLLCAFLAYRACTSRQPGAGNGGLLQRLGIQSAVGWAKPKSPRSDDRDRLPTVSPVSHSQADADSTDAEEGGSPHSEGEWSGAAASDALSSTRKRGTNNVSGGNQQ